MKIAVYTDNYEDLSLIGADTPDGTPDDGGGLTDFITFIKRALEILSPADNPLRLEPALPSHALNTEPVELKPFMVWTVESMMPGKLGGKPHGNPDAGHREVLPRLRQTVTDSEGVPYDLYAQTMQAEIRFDVWAKDAADAERITEWFRRFFMIHIAPLSGSSNVWLKTRKSDKEVEKLNTSLHVRSLLYHVQFEEITAVRTETIQAITVQITEQSHSTS
jgi:hypothetical protein